jgi:hypothetical protein
MYRDYKVVVVTPAGRKRYLEILIPYVMQLKPIVDEYVLWVNTTNQEDIQYIKNVARDNSSFIKLLHTSTRIDGNHAIHSFFPHHIDERTIYIRFDDDIVYIDNIEYLKNFLDFRIDNPFYFLVYANILNNAVISYLHQRFGNIELTKDNKVSYECLCPIGWKTPDFAVDLHKNILANGVAKFRFPGRWNLYNNERVSINVICWLGSTFAKFGGKVGVDEENWLSVDKPRELGIYNCIYGGFICVHYAFYTQREKVEANGMVNQYRNFMKANIKEG